jgi:hypothetical protein
VKVSGHRRNGLRSNLRLGYDLEIETAGLLLYSRYAQLITFEYCIQCLGAERCQVATLVQSYSDDDVESDLEHNIRVLFR